MVALHNLVLLNNFLLALTVISVLVWLFYILHIEDEKRSILIKNYKNRLVIVQVFLILLVLGTGASRLTEFVITKNRDARIEQRAEDTYAELNSRLNEFEEYGIKEPKFYNDLYKDLYRADYVYVRDKSDIGKYYTVNKTLYETIVEGTGEQVSGLYESMSTEERKEFILTNQMALEAFTSYKYATLESRITRSLYGLNNGTDKLMVEQHRKRLASDLKTSKDEVKQKQSLKVKGAILGSVVIYLFTLLTSVVVTFIRKPFTRVGLTGAEQDSDDLGEYEIDELDELEDLEDLEDLDELDELEESDNYEESDMEIIGSDLEEDSGDK